MKPVTEAAGPAPYDAPLKVTPEPDYAAMTPCSDAVFEAYRSLYGYVKTDLDPRVESRQDWSADTVLEKVSFLDAGGGERIYAYIFLPRRTPPPYQSIVYFPGSSALQLDSVFEYGSVKSREVELYTRKGRAFVFPVFWNTFERRVRPLPPRDRRYLRDRMIRHDRELSRVLDYLETRPDFDPTRIAYQGLSWGPTPRRSTSRSKDGSGRRSSSEADSIGKPTSRSWARPNGIPSISLPGSRCPC